MSPGRALAALGVFVVGWWAALFVGRGRQAALDAILYFYPLYMATWARIAEGGLPLWNPYQLCGLPWLGTLQGGFAYPTHVLYAVLPAPTAFAVSSALHLAGTAIAMAVFVRRLGLGPAAAFLAAVVWALRGQVAFSLVSPNFIEAVAWMPVGAVALVDLVRAPSGRSIALLAVATGASFLAGYPQPTVYMVYAWGSLFVALLLHEGVRPGGWPRRVAAMAGAFALGGGLAAVQMLPAMELAAVGTRAPDELAERIMLPFGANLTPALMILGRETITEAPYAFGVVVLGLVAAALVGRGHRIVACWALVVGALAAIWSLGRFTPFFDAFLLLPAVRWFRMPSRILFVLDFCVAVAAAVGLTAVRGYEGKSGRARSRDAWAVAAAVGAGIAVLVTRIRDGWVPAGRGTLGLVVAGGVVAVAAALPFVGGAMRRRLALGLVALATVEISRNPWGHVRLPYAAEEAAPYRLLEEEFARVAQRQGHDRIWPVLAALARDRALKLCTMYRLRSIVDYEPLNLRRQAEYFTFLTEGSSVPTRYPWVFGGDIDTFVAPAGVPPLAARRRLLDLASARWLLFRPGAPLDPDVAAFIRDAGLVRQPWGGRLVVFENRAALPRAFVTYRALTAPPSADALLAVMANPRFDPLAGSWVEGPAPFEVLGDVPRGHPATFVRDDEDVVELDVRLERQGLVVLGDSYYPGWRATVDGTPAPILATNHLFRGVPVPAGPHRVRFVYAPASVRLGAAASLVALVAVAWLAIRPRLRQRRDAEPDGQAAAPA